MSTVIIIIQIILSCMFASSPSIKLLRTKSMVQHWNDYQYPMWFMNITALLETTGVIGVIAGLWIPEILKYAAGLFVTLIIGAIHAHLFRAKHKPVMAINALVMLLLSITLMVV
ncbi:DoxX family protein [Paenibacillus apiarius]|uniref:DoxX family protein n=1 Tax=Paenibacillus apiarius TaxID=46240 RepID=A0ABT4DZM3_9BACL|nr:DoxX family protein [Paenibacillus apiarius]MCY9517526.1 DoxX family protein [Paenibacillus apiarius]MCY9522195.1 DoxX family protein [Paenibacillus apiarius]MCY9552229.1 DoxX family protein [Paenibacillus apiarius]MCY9560108.1 DoxX family protein [Paenibacillus apiarius]MCY9683726.1 DoxX family protein [Paenibacillus apiarius]